MEYSKLTIRQQLSTVRQQIAGYEQEHYNLSLQDLVNDGPTPVGTADGQEFTTEDREKILEKGINELKKEASRLEALLPKNTKETHTGQADEADEANASA